MALIKGGINKDVAYQRGSNDKVFHLLLKRLNLLEEGIKPESILKQLENTGYTEEEIEFVIHMYGRVLDVSGSPAEILEAVAKEMSYTRPEKDAPAYVPSNTELLKITTLLIKAKRDQKLISSNFLMSFFRNFGKFQVEYDNMLKSKLMASKTWDDVVKIMEEIVTKTMILGNQNIVIENDKCILIKLDPDKGDLCTLKFGKDTNWCTAKDSRSQMPKSYKEGDFYIIVNKFQVYSKSMRINKIPAEEKFVLWIDAEAIKKNFVKFKTIFLENNIFNKFTNSKDWKSEIISAIFNFDNLQNNKSLFILNDLLQEMNHKDFYQILKKGKEDFDKYVPKYVENVVQHYKEIEKFLNRLMEINEESDNMESAFNAEHKRFIETMKPLNVELEKLSFNLWEIKEKNNYSFIKKIFIRILELKGLFFEYSTIIENNPDFLKQIVLKIFNDNSVLKKIISSYFSIINYNPQFFNFIKYLINPGEKNWNTFNEYYEGVKSLKSQYLSLVKFMELNNYNQSVHLVDFSVLTKLESLNLNHLPFVKQIYSYYDNIKTIVSSTDFDKYKDILEFLVSPSFSEKEVLKAIESKFPDFVDKATIIEQLYSNKLFSKWISIFRINWNALDVYDIEHLTNFEDIYDQKYKAYIKLSIVYLGKKPKVKNLLYNEIVLHSTKTEEMYRRAGAYFTYLFLYSLFV